MKYINWKYTLTRGFMFGTAGFVMGHYNMGLDSPGFWIICLCMLGIQITTAFEESEFFKKSLDEFIANLSKAVDEATSIGRKEK
jgi:hypothetical protein